MTLDSTKNPKPRPMLHSNAKEVVAESPELLSQIFLCADNEDLATYSEICKKWQSAAMAVRWRDVWDPVSLFSILAPMIARGPDRLFAFSRPIGASDWKRFEKYGRCVRSIQMTFNFSRQLHPSAFAAIASTRVTLNFLPLLRTLYWQDTTNLPFLPVFLHPNVTDLRLTFGPINDINDMGFFNNLLESDIPARMPQLTALNFTVEDPTGRLANASDAQEYALLELITGYPNLRQLGIPPAYASPRILDRISTLERLVHLRICNTDLHASCDTWNPPRLIPSNAGDQDNTSLSCIDSINASYATLSKYLQSFTNFHSLTHLTAMPAAIEPHETIENMFRLIGERCRSLTNLVVMSESIFVPRDLMQAAAADPSRRITFDTLQPLATLSHLQTLYLSFFSPIWVTDDEFGRLFSNFNNLQRLRFNSRPEHYLDDPPLTLGAVRTLINCCPEIRQITLFLDATAPIPANTQTCDPTSDAALLVQHIESLDFGLSNIRDPVEVALALSSMMSTSYHPCPVWEGEPPEASRRLEAWEEVYRDMPIYQRARSAERQRVFAWVKQTKADA